MSYEEWLKQQDIKSWDLKFRAKVGNARRFGMVCPHCGLSSKGIGAMKRHHFNNCRSQNASI
jgi:hypothetical protein